MRWHRSLGDNAQKTWDVCQAPPKTATGFERLWQAIARFIAELIAQILNVVKF